MARRKKGLEYKDCDWSKWPEPPTEGRFNDWVICRLEKGAPMTQGAIDRAEKHVSRLVSDGICSVDTAMMYQGSCGWRGIEYSWVVREISKDMDGHSVSYHAPPPSASLNRSTRDIPIEDELNNKDWANEN